MSLAKQNNYDDPLDSIEMIASLNDWTFERSGKEISIIAKGERADYQISISWLDNFQGLSLVCGFDLRFNKQWLCKFEPIKMSEPPKIPHCGMSDSTSVELKKTQSSYTDTEISTIFGPTSGFNQASLIETFKTIGQDKP